MYRKYCTILLTFDYLLVRRTQKQFFTTLSDKTLMKKGLLLTIKHIYIQKNSLDIVEKAKSYTN